MMAQHAAPIAIGIDTDTGPHTDHSALEFHPHIHLAMPGAAFDAKHGLWRSLRKTGKCTGA